MCGIVGALGYVNSFSIALEGIKRLEYRGYDSAGIAFIKNERIVIYKDKGRINNLINTINNNITSDLCIAHTRWATHGIASKENAHPHLSFSQRFAIVHNGIIENYQKLKFEYLKDIELKSQTDTEIIVNLIDFFSKQLSTSEAIRKTMSLLEGSYACLLIDAKNPKQLYFFKDKSPLLIGISNNGTSLASDITGLIGNCDKYLVLDDKTFGIANKNQILLYDIIGIKKEFSFSKLNLKLEEINKFQYDHFMLKEIHEQPFIIRGLIEKYFDNDKLLIDEKLINKIKKSDKINIVACGSSMYASYLGKYYFEKLCNIPTEVFCASELVYSKPLISLKPFFIFISQSGETADLIAVIKKFKKCKYKSLAITNSKESTLARLANYNLDIYAGKEIAVASTKSYTATIATLAVLARAVSGIKTNLKNNLKSVSYAMEEVLNNKEVCRGLAYSIKDSTDLFYIGRGLDYWVSLEAALKLKEIAYIHTEGFSSGELKHGPIALIKPNTPVIAIITQEGTNMITRSNLAETKARSANCYVISSKGVSEPSDDIIIPNVSHYLSPLVVAVCVQLIAYYCSVIRGNDVDRPRNLAKSVTVE